MTSLRLVIVAGVLIAGFANAQENEPFSKSEEAVQREIARLNAVKPLPPIRPLNSFSLYYELGLNIRTTFKGFGGYRITNPGPASSGANHTYDDGYNYVDSTGNNHSDQGYPNTTTYWGYKNDSQWNHSANTISMHSAASQPFADVKNDDPRQGFQMAYERIICQSEKWYWGIETSFGFTKIDVNEDKTVTAPVLVTTDAYAIPQDLVFDTLSVPAAPYNGPFAGSLGTSLLSDIPMRSVAANGQMATVVSDRHFDANVWQLQLGPKLHLPICNRLELDFAGGVGLAVFDSSFGFREQVFLPASSSLTPEDNPPTQRGSSESLGVLVGGFLAGNLAVPIYPDERIFVGVKWQDLGTYQHRIGSRVAQVDFTGAISVNIGFGVSF
ncbi:MAG: hypothetical protein JWO95_2226 [Verrucomicrobiales bacterium]|nr:hypothetical protein [Verrucomicrobiales bacterium]